MLCLPRLSPSPPHTRHEAPFDAEILRERNLAIPLSDVLHLQKLGRRTEDSFFHGVGSVVVKTVRACPSGESRKLEEVDFSDVDLARASNAVPP